MKKKMGEQHDQIQKKRRRRCEATITSFEYLPENVIQHIQSFLSQKEARRSSLICKSWLRAWSTFPALQFQLDDIESATDFVKFVDKTLERYLHENLIVEKLKLSLNLWFSYCRRKEYDILQLDSHVNRWLRIAASQRGLKELTLSLNLSYKEYYGSLSLDLAYEKMDFRSLRVLELSRVDFDKQDIRQLFSGCNFPTVEKINILFCTGFNRIIVDNLGCLVEFRLVVTFEIVILDIVDCPRLALFKFKNLSDYEDDLEWRWQHWNFVMDFSTFSNLRSLSFCKMGLDNELFNKIMSSHLPCLEKLSVKHSFRLDIIDVSSPSLIELCLRGCNRLNEIKLREAPKLRLIDYDAAYAPNLSYDPNMKLCDQLKAELCFRLPVGVPDAAFFLRLREFVALSHKIDIYVQLKNYKDSNTDSETDSESDDDDDDDDESKSESESDDDDESESDDDDADADDDDDEESASLRSITPLPSGNSDKEVSLDARKIRTRYILPFLDNFLGVCRPKHIEVRIGSNCQKMLDFFSKPLIERESSSCCTSNYNKCWRHYLQEVEIRYKSNNSCRKKDDEEEEDDDEWQTLLSSLPWKKIGNARSFLFRLKWLDIFRIDEDN